MSKKSGRGLIIYNNKVLLIKRNNNGDQYYAIPGGKKEKGESIEQTVVREVFEETGINISIINKIGVGNGPKRSHHFYLCKYLGGNIVPEQNKKASATNTYNPVWLDIDTTMRTTIQPDCLKNMLFNYLNDSIKTLNRPIISAAKNIK